MYIVHVSVAMLIYRTHKYYIIAQAHGKGHVQASVYNGGYVAGELHVYIYMYAVTCTYTCTQLLL